jgi:hypothetical protein
MSKERLVRQYFTQAEAEAKVGRQIQTRVEFSGVPQGTTGRVISADKAGWAKPPFGQVEETYDVAIQWDLPRPEPFADLVIPAGTEPNIHIQTGKPLVDWFTRDEYEGYLNEVAPESAKSE